MYGGRSTPHVESTREDSVRMTSSLDALLHAYRCGHKVFARRLLELAGDQPPSTLAALADFTLEYTDAISTLASTAYVDHARHLTAAAVDEQAALLDLLLAGHDESDRRATSSLRKAGFLDGRQSFCVVLAHSTDPAHMLDAARARRLADTLDVLLPPALARRLIDVRGGTVTLVLAGLRRLSGWTAPLPTLSARVAECLTRAGNDVLVGGAGVDVFVLGQPFGGTTLDTITDSSNYTRLVHTWIRHSSSWARWLLLLFLICLPWHQR